MKAVILLAVIGCATALLPADLKFEFQQWQTKHAKFYARPEETQYRINVFTENFNKVTEHNNGAKHGHHSFTLEMNQFADMTNEEYKSRMLGYNPVPMASTAAYTYAPVASVPTSWDWRTQTPAVVNAVKDQGQCGACWAFSAIATVEGAVAHKTGNLQAFSEQQLVDCVDGGADTCSIGGEMYQGVDYVAKMGAELGSSYPYSASSGGGCKYSASKVVAHIKGYANITSGDEAALTSAAYTQPIVSVGIDASSFWFQLYSSGVYDDASCKNGADQLDHGVAVIGFGKDSASGKEYYIVRNSWAATWGQAGYIWMVRNKSNQCGIATQACFATV